MDNDRHRDLPKETSRPYSRPQAPDTSAVEITDAADIRRETPIFRIPPGGRDGSPPPKRIKTARYSGAAFVRHGTASSGSMSDGKGCRDSGAVVSEYDSSVPLIHRVTVHSWPGSHGFYEKFVRDAAISHNRHGSEAPHVPYFSYIPQYSQLSTPQWEYYLYMRERCEAGTSLREADFSYILLYIYEIINLGEILTPEDGAQRLANAWSLYRELHPALDRYMSEWMADFCLARHTPLPRTLASLIPAAAARSTIKEFYFDAADELGIPSGLLLRENLSDYDPSRSRCTSAIRGFRDEVFEVFDAEISAIKHDKRSIFRDGAFREVNITRDAFCGSLCSSSIKRRLGITLKTNLRSPEIRKTVTDLMKSAENEVRRRHGIRTRLQAPPLHIAADGTEKRGNADEAEYLCLYDAPDIPFTAQNAAAIEIASWRNAELLTDTAEDEFQSEIEESISGAVSGGSGDITDAQPSATDGTTIREYRVKSDGNPDSADVPFSDERYSARVGDADAEDCALHSSGTFEDRLSALDRRLVTVLLGAMNGNAFSSLCREHGLFADDAAARINELAVDQIGDVILEPDAGDYTFVEDYRDDVSDGSELAAGGYDA